MKPIGTPVSLADKRSLVKEPSSAKFTNIYTSRHLCISTRCCNGEIVCVVRKCGQSEGCSCVGPSSPLLGPAPPAAHRWADGSVTTQVQTLYVDRESGVKPRPVCLQNSRGQLGEAQSKTMKRTRQSCDSCLCFLTSPCPLAQSSQVWEVLFLNPWRIQGTICHQGY